MTTLAYVYKWTHLPTLKWYIGSRTGKGCHPNDGYLCSSKIVKPMIQENKDNWKREIVAVGSIDEMLLLEAEILKVTDAKNDPRSFNQHNGDGKFSRIGIDQSGDKNPMFGKTSFTKGKTYEELYGPEKATQLKNLRRENATGRKMSSSSVEKLAKSISIATKGKPKTETFKEKLRKPKKENHKLAISKALAGKTRSEIHSQNLSRAIKNSRASCIFCGLTSTKSAITRYHNNNCRKKNENN